MRINEKQQNEATLFIRDLFDDYKNNSQSWRNRMERIYKSVTSFQMPEVAWSTDFKVNKGHEIENKILPRIIARNPKPIVSFKSDEYADSPEEEIATKKEEYNKRANAVQDKLQAQFEKQDMVEVLRLVAKSGVRYGLGIAKVKNCYKISRTPKKVEEKEYDEFGNEIVTYGKKIEEKVAEFYAGLEMKSWTEIYFDPRYNRLEDMPAIIELKNNIRLSYFTQHPDKKKFMNIDKLVDLVNVSNNIDTYKERLLSLLGINYTDQKIIKTNTLDIKCFYGYYDFSDKDDATGERLYEIWTVNDTVVIYCNEISFMPFEDFRVFEDTEQYFPTWFIESSLGLQDEMNFKKNKASEYINKALNRNWIVSMNSWIDPRKLATMKQWEVILTTMDAQTAMANMVEIPHRQLPSDYFQEQNDIDRQIQSASFTIDTTAPKSNQSLTNTATGIKVQDRDTSFVIDEVRGHFEDFVTRISYKLIQADYDNMETNIKVKKRDWKWFREINKEAIRDAISRYEIRIEAGSTSYDSIESRRSDAIAVWNLGMQAKQAWVPVDLKERYERIMDTFEGIDTTKLFEETPPQVPQIPWMTQTPWVNTAQAMA